MYSLTTTFNNIVTYCRKYAALHVSQRRFQFVIYVRVICVTTVAINVSRATNSSVTVAGKFKRFCMYVHIEYLL